MIDRSRTVLAALRRRSRALIAGFASLLGIDELLLLAALALIAYGCWPVWRPGSFLVPGFVLLWIVIPSRAPFIARLEPTAKSSRRKS